MDSLQETGDWRLEIHIVSDTTHLSYKTQKRSFALLCFSFICHSERVPQIRTCKKGTTSEESLLRGLL